MHHHTLLSFHGRGGGGGTMTTSLFNFSALACYTGWLVLATGGKIPDVNARHRRFYSSSLYIAHCIMQETGEAELHLLHLAPQNPSTQRQHHFRTAQDAREASLVPTVISFRLWEATRFFLCFQEDWKGVYFCEKRVEK